MATHPGPPGGVMLPPVNVPSFPVPQVPMPATPLPSPVAPQAPGIPPVGPNKYFFPPMREGSDRLQQLRDWSSAEDLIEAQFDPLENQLQRNLWNIRTGEQRDINTQKGFGQLYDTRLQEIQDALMQQLQGVGQRTSEAYQRAGERTREGFGEARNVANQAMQGIEGRMAEQTNRLGLQDALTDPMARLRSEMQALQARNQANEASATGVLGNLQADLEGLAQMDLSIAGREGQQQRYNLANTVQSNIGQLQQMAREAEYQGQGQLADLAATRGAALRNAYREVVESRSDRERQARLDALNEEVARNTMQLQNFQMQMSGAEFGLKREESLFNRSLSTQMLQLERVKLEREWAQTMDPIQRRGLEQQIAQNDLKLRQMQAGTTPTGMLGQ